MENDIRRWMRLCEAVSPKMYLVHGSSKEFPVGFVLLPQTDGYVHAVGSEAEEEIFERLRPPECLPRNKSVYMLASTNIQYIDAVGGSNDYVYHVKHQGKVERNDLGWYSHISTFMSIDGDDPEIIATVKNYWAGVRYPDRDGALWEYRSPSAVIVKLIEKNV